MRGDTALWNSSEKDCGLVALQNAEHSGHTRTHTNRSDRIEGIRKVGFTYIPTTSTFRKVG